MLRIRSIQLSFRHAQKHVLVMRIGYNLELGKALAVWMRI
jgi:hypothetical protein